MDTPADRDLDARQERAVELARAMVATLQQVFDDQIDQTESRRRLEKLWAEVAALTEGQSSDVPPVAGPLSN